MYICSNYPECDSFVGCIRGTITPYGSLANKELRKARKLAHIIFDRGWKSYGVFTRYDAYKKLEEATGLERPHIGELSIEQCHTVVNFFTEFYKPYNRGRRPDEKRNEESSSN